MNCKFCVNYMSELDRCKYCHFEYDESYNPYARDDWDILNLDMDEEWTHIQIADRLKYHKIEFLMCDIWCDDNMAWIIGCRESANKVADVLNMHEEAIYNDVEHGLMILNLFQEKAIRFMNQKHKDLYHSVVHKADLIAIGESKMLGELADYLDVELYEYDGG